jgi:hypothetical protein
MICERGANHRTGRGRAAAEAPRWLPPCADDSRLLRQHDVRLINVATQQDLNRMKWRLDTLSWWYIAGWVLIFLMICAAVLLNHFWH